MSILDSISTDHLWSFLRDNFGSKGPEFAFARALVEKYRDSEPIYISLYDLKKILQDTGLNTQLTEKQIINFLCFETELLNIYFRFIDTDDEHFDFDLELIQGVLSEETQRFGNKTYTAEAIRKNLFTQFSPSDTFLRLLKAED